MCFGRLRKTILMGICGTYRGTVSGATNVMPVCVCVHVCVSACVAVKDMDRHICSFSSGPGGDPLGEERRGSHYLCPTLTALQISTYLVEQP